MSQEAMKLAREVIQDYVDEYGPHDKDSGAQYVLNKLDSAIAEEEKQEPAGYWCEDFYKGAATLYEVPQVSAFGRKYRNKPLYTHSQQRKPQFREFIKWADTQGYDCAQTCNSDTGEWFCLNPMTSDLWKAWQAAHGIEGKA